MNTDNHEWSPKERGVELQPTFRMAEFDRSFFELTIWLEPEFTHSGAPLSPRSRHIFARVTDFEAGQIFVVDDDYECPLTNTEIIIGSAYRMHKNGAEQYVVEQGAIVPGGLFLYLPLGQQEHQFARGFRLHWSRYHCVSAGGKLLF